MDNVKSYIEIENNKLFVFELLGCVIIGYMAWVLATSVTVSQFLDGTLVSRMVGKSNRKSFIVFNICIY